MHGVVHVQDHDRNEHENTVKDIDRPLGGVDLTVPSVGHLDHTVNRTEDDEDTREEHSNHEWFQLMIQRRLVLQNAVPEGEEDKVEEQVAGKLDGDATNHNV